MPKKAIFVIGGTGLGKTKLGVKLCLALNGEVINSDAMQLYRGLPIATAQPTIEERQGITHHLMGVLDAQQTWTVRDYRTAALQIMEDIWSKDKVPIVVGGTLYYVQSLIWKSLLDEKPIFPGEGLPYESKVEEESAYEKLVRLDPERANQLHPNDSRKIARSLEIIQESGGKSFREVAQTAEEEVRLDCIIFWLDCPDQKELEGKLRGRIVQMMNNGLIPEAERFLDVEASDRNIANKKGVFQAIGFREMIPLLNKDLDEKSKEKLMDECIELLVIKHRQYVKSQIKWIRNRVLTRTAPVYRLVVNKIENWEQDVYVKALTIAKQYINDEVVHPDFQIVNKTHEEISKREAHKSGKICELCGGKMIIGSDQWEKHIISRGHRKKESKLKRRRRFGPNEDNDDDTLQKKATTLSEEIKQISEETDCTNTKEEEEEEEEFVTNKGSHSKE